MRLVDDLKDLIFEGMEELDEEEFDEAEETRGNNIFIFLWEKLKRKFGKKVVSNKVIAVIWRALNWLFICSITLHFTQFLFRKTFFNVLPYVAPGIPWEGAVKIIFFILALNVAFNSSAETTRDKFRFNAGVALSGIPTMLMLLAGEVGLFSLFWAGLISFSVYREKIFTDSKVRRTPPRRKRRELSRTEDGKIIFDEYDV